MAELINDTNESVDEDNVSPLRIQVVEDPTEPTVSSPPTEPTVSSPPTEPTVSSPPTEPTVGSSNLRIQVVEEDAPTPEPTAEPPAEVLPLPVDAGTTNPTSDLPLPIDSGPTNTALYTYDPNNLETINDDWSQSPTIKDALEKWDAILGDPNVASSSLPGIGVVGTPIFTHPETGEQTYLNRPAPTIFGDGAKTDWVSLLGTGSAEFAGQVAETGAAIFDRTLGRKWDTNLTETVDRATPDVESRGLAQDLIAEGLPMILAGGWGATFAAAKLPQVGAGLNRVTSAAARVLRGFGILTAGEIAAVAGASDEAEGLLVGDGALLSIVGGLDLGDKKSEKVLAHRFTLLADSLISGGVIVGGGTAIASASKTVWDFMLRPLVNIARNDRGIESVAFKDVVDSLTNVTITTSENESRVLAANLTEYVAQNRQTLIDDLADPAGDQRIIQFDTLSAMLQGTDNPALRTQIESLRNGALQQSNLYPQTAAAVGNPNRVLKEQLDNQAQDLGGATRVEQQQSLADAGETLVDSGRREIDAIRQPLVDAEARLSTAVEDIVRATQSDVELTGIMDKLQDITGTEVRIGPDANIDTISQSLQNSYETMRSQKNARYAAIEGGEIDPDMIVSAFSNLTPSQITAGMEQVGNKSPIREFLTQVKPRNIPDEATGVGRMETEDEIASRMDIYLADNGATFGTFYNEIRPALSTLANNMFAANNPGGGGIVRDIVKFIDNDMVEHVARTSPDLADAAREAKRYYTEDFAPIWRGSGVMSNYANTWENTIGRSPNGNTTSGRGLDQAGYNQASDRQVASLVAPSANRYEVRGLAEALEAGGESSEAVADYFVLDVVTSLSDQMRPGMNNADIDFAPFAARLTSVASQLNMAFPEKAAQLNQLLRRVEDAQGDVAEIQRLIEPIRESVSVASNNLLKGELQTFFNRNDMLELSVTSNPRDAFESIFKSKESVDTISRLNARIDTLDPGRQLVVRDGMQTAYNRWLDSRIFSSGAAETGGIAPLANSRASKALEDITSDLRIGEEIFRDTPEVMETIREMVRIASEITTSKGTTPVRSMSATAYNQAAQSATNKFIFLFMGPLSRVGTRTRAIASNWTQSEETLRDFSRIKDRIFADPEEFARLAARYNSNPRNQEAEEMLVRLVTGSTTRAVNDSGERDPSNDSPVGNSTINRVNSALDPVREFTDQTSDAFGLIRDANP
jgi:hypothetical protein